jgi:hypothetical protein
MSAEHYLKSILRQVGDAYATLQDLKDQPGDLNIIKRELAKITGTLHVIIHKLETNKQELHDYQYLASPAKYFLENHEFYREIDTMSLLYADDPMRLKHLRLEILDAIDEKNLIGHIKPILRETDE